MRINSIELKNFRNIDSAKIDFDHDINIFIGNNGQGKTNLIESFYLLSLCRSFRTRQMGQLVQFEKEFASVKGNIESNKKNLDLEVVLTSKSKKAKINHQDISKVSDFVGYLNVVVFTPDDLSLVKNGPQLRRRLMDEELGKISPVYLFNISKYNKLLKERNAFLKRMKETNKSKDLYLDVLNEQMASLQKGIITKRKIFVENLSNIASEIYGILSNHDATLNIHYQCFVKGEDYEKEILDQYSKSIYKDIKYTSTSIGVQKDDLIIELDHKSASQFASQGQQRTIVLAIKIALLELIKKEIGEYPVLLLDDVLSELDRNRKMMLLKFLNERIQTFITTTSLDDIDEILLQKARMYDVECGKIKEE